MSDLTIEEQTSAAEARKIFDNAVPLSNIIEVTASVVLNMAGKDIADTIQNESINRGVLGNLIAKRLKQNLLPKE